MCGLGFPFRAGPIHLHSLAPLLELYKITLPDHVIIQSYMANELLYLLVPMSAKVEMFGNPAAGVTARAPRGSSIK